MWLSIKMIVFGTCLCSSLHADWDPGSVFNENPGVLNTRSNREFNSSKMNVTGGAANSWNPSGLNTRSNCEFNKLKMNVTEALTNGWCSAEKAQLLMDLVLLTRPEVCVEVGAFTGSSILPVAMVLKYLNHGKVFAIDAWSNAQAIQHLDDEDPNKLWWSQVDMHAVHEGFKQLIATRSLTNFCTEIHGPSEKAVGKIPERIDFLHLDGDYSEIGALRDVELYVPKVKSGGYILLSNFYIMVNREQPKIRAFCALFDTCEFVASIEQDNAILFKKL